METAFVEEVAASLVREFLSKKGLNKTSSMMDQEHPRTALSINNRNELRKVLHLQSLYKLNKTREHPLKTILEIMTSYFLEDTISLQDTRSPAIPQNKNSKLSASETAIIKNSFSDGNIAPQTVPQTNQTESYRRETLSALKVVESFERKATIHTGEKLPECSVWKV
ncbi:probable ubiquitin carboxyl-terminal hydrolase MINDY-4 [Heteronotia binoei]|uniref:probable ubiquitin carboxyl-terminal hydrolase MINDY-4 n=1 Tax=Heteronotia binoei TaxID=13085 RepID=UPI00292EA372|nr:probable ubiquitin carboxyl-terminal hydrolase MINDY-4 [Heteronotia binoei]